MVQHQMLEPMHKELMLGVIVEARVKRYVEERQADPKRYAPGNADTNVARPSCIQRCRDNENRHEPERRFPWDEQVEQRHGRSEYVRKA